MTETNGEGVFEIRDHTTASPWEELSAQIEGILRFWGRVHNQETRMRQTTTSSSSHGTLSFGKRFLRLELYGVSLNFNGSGTNSSDSTVDDVEFVHGRIPVVLRSLLNIQIQDPRSHPVRRFFGLENFMVLTALGEVLTENEAVLLLSALCMASVECQMGSVPAFVQIGEARRSLYCGYFEGGEYGGRFMVDSMPSPSGTGCCSVSSLSDRFSHFLGIDVSSLPSFGLSYRQSFVFDFSSDRSEPLDSMKVCASWPNACPALFLSSIPTGDASDSGIPNVRDAPDWSISCSFRKERTHRVSSLIRGLWASLDAICSGNWKVEESTPLRALLSISGKSASFVYERSPEDVENLTLDAVSDLFEDDRVGFRPLPIGLRGSAAGNSLTAALAVRIAEQLSVSAIQIVWDRFCARLQWHADHLVPLPHIGSSTPDLSGCLLHQKLQAFNCCIGAILRQSDQSQGVGVPVRSVRPVSMVDDMSEGDGMTDGWEWDAEWGSEGDFYFDAAGDDLSAAGRASYSDQNTGLPGLSLLRSHRPLMCPQQLDYPPLTTDRLVKIAGVDAVERRLNVLFRSRIKADMAAFRAANPSAVFEDFVRFYSPRDWVVVTENGEEQAERSNESGKVSLRMMSDGRSWRTLWETSSEGSSSVLSLSLFRMSLGHGPRQELLLLVKDILGFPLLSLCRQFAAVLIELAVCALRTSLGSDLITGISSFERMGRKVIGLDDRVLWLDAKELDNSGDIALLAEQLSKEEGPGVPDAGDLLDFSDALAGVEGLVEAASSLMDKLGGENERLIRACVSQEGKDISAENVGEKNCLLAFLASQSSGGARVGEGRNRHSIGHNPVAYGEDPVTRAVVQKTRRKQNTSVTALLDPTVVDVALRCVCVARSRHRSNGGHDERPGAHRLYALRTVAAGEAEFRVARAMTWDTDSR